MSETNGVGSELSSLIRAKYPVIGVQSKEEARVERMVRLVAQAMPKPSEPFAVRFWSVTQGVTDEDGQAIAADLTNPTEVLQTIQATQERAIYVLRDFHHYLTEDRPLRALRDTARTLRKTKPEVARCVVLLSPVLNLPVEAQADVHMMHWPLPKRADLARIVDETLAKVDESIRAEVNANTDRDAVIEAALGLTAQEAANAFARSIVDARRLDYKLIMREKKAIVAESGVLEWMDPLPGGFDDVGGLENVKEWLLDRQAAFSAEARAYGLPLPKGVILAGVPRCGKSYMAKAVAAAWKLPLFRLNLGAVFGRYVGDSEANLRRAFETIELVGRCVVLLDEFDKMFSAGGESDGGTTNRVTGEVLTWLQERTSEAFVIAAMNRVEQIAESRPELIGKGRWDELFFVDLPNVVEREQQFRVHLRKFRVALADKEVTRLAEVTDGFNGAEIEACVKDSLFRAFKQGRRPVIYDDIGIEIGKTVPQSKSARTSIESLRTWAKGRARMASRPIETAQRAGATLEVA